MTNQQKSHYVYKVTCPTTNRYYIGVHSTFNLSDGYAGSGTWSSNYRKKHGKNILLKEILSFCDSREDAFSMEIIEIDKVLNKDPLCMNLAPGGNQWGKMHKGKTKLNNLGVADTSQKLTGRTKETHKYIREAGIKVSKALSGRTKETHKYIADVAALFASRNKDNHAGVASQAEKIRGRTKETHDGVASQSNKMRGRTKETHTGVSSQAIQITGRTKETHDYLKSMSLKKKKTSAEQDNLIYDLRKSGKKFMEIKEILHLDVTYGTLLNAFNRVKSIKEIETIVMEQE